MTETVILSGARTPIGRLSGALASFSATRLGGLAIAATLDRAGLAGEDVDFVFMGQVVQAGAGQVPARQAAYDGGIPLTVPANTVNKACLSGLNAIVLAHRMIVLGEADIVVAGGMESMTNAPYLLPGARAGYRYGDATVSDSLTTDGLFCAFDICLMGTDTVQFQHLPDYLLASGPFIISRLNLEIVLEQLDEGQIGRRFAVRHRKRLQHQTASLRGDLELVEQPGFPQPRFAHHTDDLAVALFRLR